MVQMQWASSFRCGAAQCHMVEVDNLNVCIQKKLCMMIIQSPLHPILKYQLS
jgi:hypothetical protein